MLIREMTMDDYPAAYELWTEIEGMGLGEADSREAIAAFLDRNPGHSFVCIIDQQLVGTVLCGHDGRRGFLYHVAVSKHYRNRGIGRQLVDRALRSLKAAGITKCHLMVYADNLAGCRFWEKTGWLKRSDIILFSTLT